jgi:hypothetical protein
VPVLSNGAKQLAQVVQLGGSGFGHRRAARPAFKAARIWIEPYFYEEVCNMTSQNATGKDINAQDKPLDDSALTAAKPSEGKRELTDDETAAVVGGMPPAGMPATVNPTGGGIGGGGGMTVPGSITKLP